MKRLTLAALIGALVAALVWATTASLGSGSGSVRTAQRQLDAASRPPPSTNPYTASLRYARCMRRHGVPHPDPDKHGDFSLTPAQERRMRSVDEGKRKAADNACFYHLRGLNLTPLSPHAIALANKVVNDLGRCLRSHGHEVGRAQVRNLGRGRASFGFESLPGRDRAYWQSPAGKRELKTLERDHLTCERRVNMAARLTKIIADDRRRVRVDF